MTRFYFDSETFSEVDLKVVGTYAYADHPSTEVILATYAIGDGPVRRWSPAEGEPIPADLLAALRNPSLITAHNSAFDRNVVPRALYRMGILTAAERDRLLTPAVWRCTMVKALAHALPGDLDTLGRVLGLREDQAKITEGKKLIQRFCKPAPANHKRRRYDHTTHPELWARFVRYAEMDIVAMRECDRRMPDWNLGPREHALWLLDQQINDRGFYCDRELVDAAVRTTEEEKHQMATRFAELTGGCVAKATQRDQFRAFLKEHHGLELENTQAETLRTVRKRVPDDSDLAELLDIALATNKTSTSKYARIQPAIGADGRFRGGLQFAGAGRTRRWGGRMFQPQNLPSRGLPKAKLVDAYVTAVKAGVHTVCFDNLMWYGSAALRGVVTAPPGRHIVAADLSNIEGRMLAWVAREEWKLEAFRAYDAGTGPDLYNITANMIIGVDPWNVPKKVRNVFGKVPDLASGYQGGVAGYQTFAHAYGVRMADHWDTIQQSIDPAIIAKARKNLAKGWAKKQIADLEISELEWLASEACKLAWRARHPATVTFWYALQEAAIKAIEFPGSVHEVTCLKLSCREHAGHLWLQILLPSGNRLCYFHPHIIKAEEYDEERDELRVRKSLAYWALSSEEGGPRIWQRTFTHGGKLTGNVCVTADTQVLTQRGLVPIVDVTRQDKVWDGIEWVGTNGPVFNGFEETGTWMGIRTTRDHQILVGNSWKKAIQMGASESAAALNTGYASAPSVFSCQASGTAALRVAFAIAAGKLRYLLVRFIADRLFAAARAGRRLQRSNARDTGASRLQSYERSGETATKRWSLGAAIRSTKRIGTMAGAVFEYAKNGWRAGSRFLSTGSHSLDGTIAPSIWTASTTTGTTSLETSGLYLERSTPETGATTESCPSKGSTSLLPSFGNGISQTGAVQTQRPITSTTAEARNGSWRSTTKVEKVFDLTDCGPRNRFTVMTDHGFAILHNCQTLARDVLAYNMPAIEQAGYDIVMTVHDEVVAEAPVSLNEDRMVELLATNPPWATGLPLAAAGFHHDRYMKED